MKINEVINKVSENKPSIIIISVISMVFLYEVGYTLGKLLFYYNKN